VGVTELFLAVSGNLASLKEECPSCSSIPERPTVAVGDVESRSNVGEVSTPDLRLVG
jgi:hypothetical protein